LTEISIQEKSLFSHIIFFFTLTIVVINIIPLIFPALISESLIKSDSVVNPFELGGWSIPLIVVNLAILIFCILYFKNLVPRSVQNSIKFILTFEVSKRITVIVLLLILGAYIVLTIPELTVNEGDVWADFKNVESYIETFPYSNEDKDSILRTIVKFFLLISSETLFQNIHIIPFMASIALLVLTYLFTFEITKKRFAGLVSMVILLQSFTFLRYDTMATYSNFWTLFYLLSLYLIYKKSFISFVPYLLSLFSKPLTIMYRPMSLFFIFCSKLSKKEKILSTMPYVVIILILFGLWIESYTDDPIVTFRIFNFWIGFTVFAFTLRFDSFVLLLILPLIVGLWLISRKGITEANSISLLIGGILLSSPMIGLLTIHDTHAYRLIPLIVFFAIGFGMFFQKNLLWKIK